MFVKIVFIFFFEKKLRKFNCVFFIKKKYIFQNEVFLKKKKTPNKNKLLHSVRLVLKKKCNENLKKKNIE